VKNKKILVICPHPEGVAPGQRLKYEQYFDFLRENGYQITVSPFMTMRLWKIVYRKGHYLEKIFWTLYGYLRRIGDLLRLPFYDGLYVFLWVVPFGPALFERLYALVKRDFVYDIDDLVFLKPKSAANPLVAWLKSKSRIVVMMQRARHVITCTPALDGFARRYNEKTTDISSTIDTDVYVPANRYRNDGPITVGWSGSHSTVQYLHLLDGVLRELAAEIPLRLLVIGDADFHIDGVEVTAISWERATEVRNLQRIDIGLYPLPDEEWVYGKSGLKALQYMALGIPTVATAIGVNFRIIEDGASGFLVRTADEWKAKIRALAAHPEIRRTIGAKARQHVERFYSVRANRRKYLAIFDQVYRGNDAALEQLVDA
jgi:glycosyltransferase involved in cell wall biosynthesis